MARWPAARISPAAGIRVLHDIWMILACGLLAWWRRRQRIRLSFRHNLGRFSHVGAT